MVEKFLITLPSLKSRNRYLEGIRQTFDATEAVIYYHICISRDSSGIEGCKLDLSEYIPHPHGANRQRKSIAFGGFAFVPFLHVRADGRAACLPLEEEAGRGLLVVRMSFCFGSS